MFNTNMFGTSGYMNNADLGPFEAEFNKQIQMLDAAGTYDPRIRNLVIGEWERNKWGIVNEARQKYSVINQPLIQSAIYGFIQRAVAQVMMQQQQAGIMPMGAMGQNPYVANNGFGGMGGNNFHNMSFKPMSSNIMSPGQPSMMDYATLTPPQNEQKPVVENQEQSHDNKLHVTHTNVPKFEAPINDDPDPVFGSDTHHNALGDLKVVAMIDGYGNRFKYASIRLNDSCQSLACAIEQAKLLYKCPTSMNYHVDITYDRIDKVNVPYDKFVSVIEQIRRAIPKITRSKNKLHFLKSIAKILNAESRGVANAIEEFLINSFLTVGRFGCVSSDVNSPLEISTLEQLIQLSDCDTPDPGSQLWQKMVGFSDRLVDVVNETIRHIVMNIIALNPSDEKDIGKIIRTHVGTVVTNDDEIVDVVGELNSRRTEFCKASADDKLNLFGIAGRIIAESTVVIIPDERVTMTTFAPENSIGHTNTAFVTFVEECCIGGKTGNVSNECTSTFEYMMLHMSLTDGKFTKCLVKHDPCITVAFDCVGTSDGWYRLIPSAQ